MNHAFLMCCLQSFCDLRRNSQCLFHMNRTARNLLGQRLSAHEFHDQEFPSAGFLHAIDRRYVGMIQ